MSTPDASAGTNRWLHGPVSDLLLGCGLLYIIIFFFLGAAGPGVTETIPLGLLPLLAVFAGAPHYGATLLRVYEQREDRRKYAFFAVGITGLLALGFGVSLFEYTLGSLLVTLYFNWNSWHYAGQNYGLAMMFLRRRGVEVTPRARQLFYASFILSSYLAIVAMNGSSEGVIYGPDAGPDAAPGAAKVIGPVYSFLPLGIPADVVAVLLGAGLVAYVACLVGAIGSFARNASFSDLLPSLLLVLTQSTWFVIPVAARQWGLLDGFLPLSSQHTQYTFMFVAFGHAVQYLWVTSYFARKTSAYPGHGLYWLRCLFAGAALWNVPGLVLAPLALGTVAYTEGLYLLIAAVANLHHFILDGAIWKLRDAGIGRVLLRQAPATEAPDVARPRRAGAWGWAAISLLGVAGVGTAVTNIWENEFGFRQARLRGDLVRMESAVGRLEQIGRPRSAHYVVLAAIARRQGDDERALAELHKSLAVRDHPKAHFEIGHIHADRSDWTAAADAYERAYALDPQPVKLVYRLADASLRAGRHDRAKEVLDVALAARPEAEALAALRRRADALAPHAADP